MDSFTAWYSPVGIGGVLPTVDPVDHHVGEHEEREDRENLFASRRNGQGGGKEQREPESMQEDVCWRRRKVGKDQC
eukprot:3048440-Rhodomonas_salina.1